MTISPKLILKLSAAFVAVASSTCFAQSQAASDNVAPAVTPDAVMTVTTTGGTAGYVPEFSGASTIVNSPVFVSGANVGIGTAAPTQTLDINGPAAFRGNANFFWKGAAHASGGANSSSLTFSAETYDSSTASVIRPFFSLLAESAGNNTASPSATLNVQYSNGTTLAETGLHINGNGTINFAPGQTFPGGGPMCIAVGGGFGSGGTTFVAPGFTVPVENSCTPWSGFTKTASSVILTTSGVACLSGTGKTLTVSVSSADPSFFGAGSQESDYIQLTRTGATGTFTGGTDQGEFGGGADQVTCTSSVLSLPDIHD